jgi:hypothetical protein
VSVEKKRTCVVCLDRSITYVFGPCGHSCACEECALKEDFKCARHAPSRVPRAAAALHPRASPPG